MMRILDMLFDTTRSSHRIKIFCLFCVAPPFNAFYSIILLYKIQMYANNNIFCVKLYIINIPLL